MTHGGGGGWFPAGPEFVPMNAICRSFPHNILDLLKGDATMGDNKRCTTLFCISSALKKLSQTTALPDSRYKVKRLLTQDSLMNFHQRVTEIKIDIERKGKGEIDRYSEID